MLVANHEYTDEVLMFRGYDPANPTREQVEIAWAAHGLSVVVVQEEHRTGKLDAVTRHHLNRRLTATSEFKVTGPAAGSALLRTSADPSGTKVLGTLNNCAGGTTPWGTTLHGEENFNQYFANGSSATDKRYGIGTGATERKWERFDKRFDLAQEPNEVAPLRLGRRARPVRPGLHAPQAHRARPLQARGRAAAADRRRPSRRLHG